MNSENIGSREELKSFWIESILLPVWDAAVAEEVRNTLIPIAKHLKLEDWVLYLEALEEYGVDHEESARRLSEFIEWARSNREHVEDFIFASGLRYYGISLWFSGDCSGALKFISELLACFEGADSHDMRILHAKTLGNAAFYAGQESGEQGLKQYLDELRALASKHDEAAIRAELAKALFNAGNSAGTEGGLKASIPYLDELRALASTHDEAAIRAELAQALVNAGVYAGTEGGVKAHLPYLDELRVLASTHDEAAIREALAKALFNAGVVAGNEGGLKASIPYLDELRALASKHDEAAIREALASALFNAGGVAGNEGGLKASIPYLDELRALASTHDEVAIREVLAKALVNAGIDAGKEGGLKGRIPYLDELRALASTHDEAAIRSELATALFNAGVDAGKEGGLKACIPYLDELRALASKHDEAAIREAFAKALGNAGFYAGAEGGLKACIPYLDEFRALASKHDEVAIRAALAKALVNAGFYAGAGGGLKACIPYLDELSALASKHDEAAIRKELAKALGNAGNHAAKEDGLKASIPYLDELRALARKHDEASIRSELAKALVNAGVDAGNEGGLKASISYLDELRALASKHDEAAIRSELATALFNAGVNAGTEGGVKAHLPYLDELRALASKHDEAAIRDALAKAFVNAGNHAAKEDGLKASIPYLDELRALANKHDEAAIRAELAKALFNSGNDAVTEGGLKASIPYLDELRALASKHDEAAIREALAKALVNAGVDAGNEGGLKASTSYLDALRALASKHDEAAIRSELATALFNAGNDAGKEGGLKERIPYLDELRALASKHDEAAIREALAKALYNQAIYLHRDGEVSGAYKACEEATRLVSGSELSSGFHERLAIFENRLRLELEQAGEIVPASGRVATIEDATDHGGAGQGEPQEGTLHAFDVAVMEGQPAAGAKERDARTRLRMSLDKIISKFSPVKARFLEQMTSGRERARRFLDSQGRFPSDASVLMVLRQWNSYTPILVDGQESDRGGGYFLRHKAVGLVIDPGYNFIEQFHIAGCKVVDITHVAITHAHDDHTAQLEQLLTLFHQYNNENEGKQKKITLLLNHSTLKKFSGFSMHKDCAYVDKVICLNAYDKTNEQTVRLTGQDNEPLGVSITVLPARHDDVFSAHYAVGLGLRVDTGNGERRILFTGDTGLYWLKRDEEGKVVKGSYLNSRHEKVYERLVNEEEKAVCEDYPAPFDKGVHLLVPHLGSIKEYEFAPMLPNPVGSSGQGGASENDLEPMFYPNHLGILGTAKMIMDTEPECVVLSEFGAELRGLRMEIAKLLQDALKEVWCDNNEKDCEGSPPFIIPGDPSIVYHIPDGHFLCHEDNSYQPPHKLEAKEVGQDRIGLFRKGGCYASLERFDKARELLVRNESKDERVYPLPYMDASK